jgi:pimeloyl-ACP methyl ester carboxylesterase
MSDGLLLIHAFPLDAGMWDEQVARFGADVSVAAPHLPGFGGTAGAGETMTMAAAADHCREAMDAAGMERAVVCGLSMGGYVALELWRRSPERLSGLILANTRAEADSLEGAAGRRKLAARLREEGTGFLVEAPPPLLSAGAPEGRWAVVRSMIAAQPAGSIAAAALGMAERPDSTGDLPRIDVPTLVITSDADALIPADVSAAMAAKIPGADFAVIPGAGHLSNLEAPADFDDLVSAHLRRCSLTS